MNEVTLIGVDLAKNVFQLQGHLIEPENHLQFS
jgi:hypothetical protein